MELPGHLQDERVRLGDDGFLPVPEDMADALCRRLKFTTYPISSYFILRKRS